MHVAMPTSKMKSDCGVWPRVQRIDSLMCVAIVLEVECIWSNFAWALVRTPLCEQQDKECFSWKDTLRTYIRTQ